MQKLLAVLLLCWLASSGVRAAESGLFPSRTWDVRQFQASGMFPSPPFFAIAQSKDGLIYAGDGVGLLEFDGRTWRRLPIELNSAVTLISATRSGGLVVGGSEILIVIPDARDLSRSIDVSAEIEGGFHGSGDFWEFAEDDAQWCVRSTALLVCSDKDGFWKLRTKTEYGRMFSGRNSIYLQEDGVGLMRVGTRTLKQMPGAEQFAGIGIYSLTESPEGNITAVTRTPQAIWRWNALESPGPPIMIDSSQLEMPIGIGVRSETGRIILPEEEKGVAIIDEFGAIVDRIEPQDLAVSPGAKALLVDREGALWVAWRTAITRIEYPSRMSYFPMPSGAYGESLSLMRTSLGLTTWRGSRAMILRPDADSRRWSFKESEVRLPIILDISQVHGHDIISTINGIRTFDSSEPVARSDHVFEVKEVSGSGTDFWVGMRRAVARMHHHNGVIEILSRRDGLSFDVVSIAQERVDELWLASLSGRVARLRFDANQSLANATLIEFDQDSGLPKGKIKLETIAGRVRFLAQHGGFMDFAADRFSPSQDLPVSETGFVFEFEKIDSDQILISNSTGNLRLLTRDIEGTFRYKPSVFDEVAGIGMTRSIHADPDGNVWLATDSGIVRIDPKRDAPTSQSSKVMIRSILSGEHVLYDGLATMPTVEVAEGGSLRFGFALPSYRAPEMNRYRSRIRPSHSDSGNWSAWSNETKRDFTNLAGGNFIFEVQAKDASGVSGGQSTVPIIVVSPWYRRTWAIAIFWIAGLLLVLAGVQWRVRALRARSAELERLVAIKTEALQLAATTDPLTGLWNRHRFGQWVRDEIPSINTNVANASDSDRVELIACVIDLDHFKRVNDQHGHAAGDAVLRAVAERLMAMRQPGDLVFRFGGEEFVYLGVQRHRSEGKKLAEQIVHEIAQINVELESGVLLDPTASVGWSVYPFYRERADLFSIDFVLGLADRALYLAKQVGRNRAYGYLPNIGVDEIDRTQADWRAQVFNRHTDFLKRV